MDCSSGTASGFGGVFGFDYDSVEVGTDESDGTVSLTIVRFVGTDGSVTVDLNVTGGNATATADYGGTWPTQVGAEQEHNGSESRDERGGFWYSRLLSGSTPFCRVLVVLYMREGVYLAELWWLCARRGAHVVAGLDYGRGKHEPSVWGGMCCQRQPQINNNET